MELEWSGIYCSNLDAKGEGGLDQGGHVQVARSGQTGYILKLKLGKSLT